MIFSRRMERTADYEDDGRYSVFEKAVEWISGEKRGREVEAKAAGYHPQRVRLRQ